MLLADVLIVYELLSEMLVVDVLVEFDEVQLVDVLVVDDLLNDVVDFDVLVAPAVLLEVFVVNVLVKLHAVLLVGNAYR